MENTSNLPGKEIGLTAYLTIIALVIAMGMNSDKKTEFGQYHIRQSLGVFLTGIAFFVIGFVPFIGWIISIFGFFFVFFLLIMGIVNAINGKTVPVPILGDKYNDWLKNI